MNNVLLVFLSLSVSGSILALILLTIKPFIRNKLSQTWQYYIWLIVIFRFLIPFTPEVSIVGELSRNIQNIANPSVAVTGETNPSINANDEYPILQDLPLQDDKMKTPAQPTYWRDILNNIWILWISIALILFVHKVASYRSFARFVRLGMKKISDTHILDIYRAVLVAANVKRQLPLYENNQVVSPMLVGIVRPILVTPALETSDDELQNIFRHELTHYKRLDFLYKWLMQITLCLHWFNPFIYLINRQINKSCELSCDEAVIKHLDENGRMTYGDALIASLKAQGNYSDFVVSMTMSENGNIVKERLDMIMNYKKKSKLLLCVTILLTILLLCGFTFAGAYNMPNFQSENVSIPLPQPPSIDSHFTDDQVDSGQNQFENNSSSSGSNNISIAKAESYKIINSPNLDIRIQTAMVTVKPASDNQVTVEYDTKIFNAAVKNVDGNWSVDISSEMQYTNNAPMVTLYLPEYQYGNVNLDIETATMNFPVKSGNITSRSHVSNVEIYLQEGFTGSLTHVLEGGNLFINSANEFNNSKVKITNDADITGTVLVPNRFTKNGKAYTYSNGTQSNVIDITLKEFGVVSLQSESVKKNPTAPDMADPYFKKAQPDSAVNNQTTLDMADSDAKGTVVINLNSNGRKNLINSSSFKARAGQVLTLEIKSTINGSVDLFLFSPSNKEQRITLGGNNDTKTVKLSEGTWAYNCTGFFDSGNISIIGTISSNQSKPSGSKDVDAAALHVMEYSHSWDIVEFLLPYMTKDGIDAVVSLNNEVNPRTTKKAADYYNLARPSQTETDNRAYTIMQNTGNWRYASPLFPYMSNSGINKVVALYNQKTGKNVNASNYHNTKNDYRPDPNAPEPDIYGGEAIELQG